MNIRHLQACLPWSIAYTEAFRQSNEVEQHRYLTHDILHVMKALGRIGGACEKIDHGKPPGMTAEELADNVVDLVICALHIANISPLGRFDLEDAVIQKIEARNGVKIPAEI